MSRFHRLNALGAAAVALSFSFFNASAHADSMAKADGIQVSGVYHSVTNGIPDYDGFDRFRDANGQPLPGWEQMLRSPG
jgi:hypothetical protein